MKVILINTLYYPNQVGGAERSVQLLAEELVNKGNEVIVISLSHFKGVKVSMVNNVKVYYIGLRNLYWPFLKKQNSKIKKLYWHFFDTYNVLMSIIVKKIIVQEKPDVVHTNNLAGFSVSIWSSIRKLKIPLIHTLRDYYLLCPKSTMFKNDRCCEKQCLDCKLLSIPRKWISFQVYYLVGISTYILQKHLDFNCFINVKNQKVIYNSCNINSNGKKNYESTNVRFGFIGELSFKKGILFLLENIIKTTGNWKLFIAGNGDYKEYVLRITDKRVNYLGFVNPNDFFQKVDVLIVPSLWQEPFGRIVIEAYANGVPVIGAAHGGIPELIEEGITGFKFIPEEPDTFIEAMNHFTRNIDLFKDMQVKCYEYAQKFMTKNIYEQYLQVYQMAIEDFKKVTK